MKELMNKINIILVSLVVFLFQLVFIDFLTINNIRPDFLIIYILYIALIYGRLVSIILAFIIGLISDLLGVSSYLGLTPLTLSITAYLSGFLYGKYERLLPYVFLMFSYALCWDGSLGGSMPGAKLDERLQQFDLSN